MMQHFRSCAHLRHPEMSAPWSLLEGKQTLPNVDCKRSAPSAPALDVEALINLDEPFRSLLSRRVSRKPWIIAIRKNDHALEGSTDRARQVLQFYAYRWMHYAGVAKLVLGADAEAVAWLRRCLEANRNYPLAHFHLAAACSAHWRRRGTQHGRGLRSIRLSLFAAREEE
jgi:hypothetical protein